MATREEPFLNVVYVADGNFLPHVATSLVSLAENAGGDISKVFVGVEKASRRCVRRLRRTGVSLFGDRFRLVSIDNNSFPALKHRDHISSTAYKKFLIDTFVDSTDRHVLYIDGDTLVCSRLTELATLTNTIESEAEKSLPALWASQDFSETRLHGSDIFRGNYFNSGVMLINLDSWRKKAPLEKLVMLVKENKGLIKGDQDALNVVFQENWQEIGAKYNSTDKSGPEQATIAIKHFAGSEKPWSWAAKHPWTALYKAYRRKSGFWPFLPTVLWFRVRRRLIRKLVDPIYLRIRRQ